MTRETPTTVGPVVTTQLEERAENNFGRGGTVERECLSCGITPFEYVGRVEGYGSVAARWECVECGNPREIPLDVERSDRR